MASDRDSVREAVRAEPGGAEASGAEGGRGFRLLVESSPDFITLHDRQGQILYANPAVQRFVEMSIAEMRESWPMLDGPVGPAREQYLASVLDTVATGRPLDAEIDWALPGGGPVVHHIRFTPLLGPDGAVERVAAFGRDVTGLRAVEREAARASAQLRQLFDALPDRVWLKDASGRYQACNPAFERLVGRREREIRGKGDGDLFRADQAALFGSLDEQVRTACAPRVDEAWITPAGGGTPLLLETIRTPLADPDGKLLGVLGVGRDVTQQHAAEELLHRREEEFRALVENAPDPVSRYDIGGRRLYVNPAFERLFADRAALVGRTPTERPVGSPEMAERIEAAIRGVVSDGAPREIEVTWKERDGGVRCHQVTYVAERDRGGAIASVLGVGRDISGLKRSEEELRKLSRAVEQSPASILITDTDGIIEYVNPRFCEVTGYAADEVIGRTPGLLKSGETPPEEYARLWATIRSGKEWRGEFQNRKKSGALYWESASISPVQGADGRITHFLAVKEDVTERKRLEEEVRRSQKMEAFGQLAGGVAHDFNNVLTVIQGSAAALADPTLGEAEKAGLAQEILDASERAARLTRQLLLFSRKKPAQLRELDLNEVVADTGQMLRRLIGEHISLETRLAPGAAPIRADLGMMEQVLMNLVVNARDAMPQGGAVVVETGTVETPAGARVRFVVRDTGQGISPEHLPHVFEPFFTTKDVGKGTGLGLATVFAIVQQHGGTIGVESQVGRGTAIEIVLPRSAAAPERRTAPRRAEAARGGGETVLLVEDDPAVRALARRVLALEGYRVLEAPSAVAAMEIWAARRDEIALVLTDMVMPGGLSGRQMGERMRADRPDLPIVYSSGHTEDVLGDLSALPGAARMLDKPYGAGALAGAVRACLDAARAGKP